MPCSSDNFEKALKYEARALEQSSLETEDENNGRKRTPNPRYEDEGNGKMNVISEGRSAFHSKYSRLILVKPPLASFSMTCL